jgi:lipopolysaccharide transport system ATP-binding protein
MSEPAIRVERLSKAYTIGASQQSHATFYDLLAHALGAPFRWFREIGAEKDSAAQFWALRDVSFDVQPGDALGIIGRNGAGKSTLLKILSRVTGPTSGRATVRGRVASLLEVGTGFHPELTGRENIFLNGAILGMKQREIRARFDAIVDFAEIDKFIDTPIKRYSSGMTVRLAFAVAAHLESEILIADEVLAVGDMAFQRKSLGKMEEAAKHGRTVLFVSHNLGAVRNLCRSVLLLENGQLHFQGPVREGVTIYERGMIGPTNSLGDTRFHGPLSDRMRFENIVFRQRGAVVTIVDPLENVEIVLRGLALVAFKTLDLNIGIFRDGFHLSYCHDAPRGAELREGRFISRFHIPAGFFKPGRYTLGIGAMDMSGDWTLNADATALEVSENWGDTSSARDRGAVGLKYSAEREQ